MALRAQLATIFDFNMKKQHGFIALISILILSSVLLASTLALAQFGIASRFFVLNLEQKASSQKLAEACLELMRVKVYNNPLYNTTGEYDIAGGKCNVETITANGSAVFSTVKVSAKVGPDDAQASTNLEADIEKSTGSTTRVIELPS